MSIYPQISYDKNCVENNKKPIVLGYNYYVPDIVSSRFQEFLLSLGMNKEKYYYSCYPSEDTEL